MKVTAIYRYPVKSMGGHELNEAMLTIDGIPGDRCWTLRDVARNDLKVGKRNPAVMGMNARIVGSFADGNPSPDVEIDTGSARLSSADASVDEALSEALGQSVRLEALRPKEDLDHYRRRKPPADVLAAQKADPIGALREVFARTEEEPLPDLSVFPESLSTYESPPGTYFDAFPLLIMSTTAIESLAAASSASNFDLRRFRPNIVIDTTALSEEFPENAWADKTARLGSATLQLHMACPRCIMTTHGFADLPKDPKIMRTLVQTNDGNLGLYASVAESGTFRRGDTLTLLD